MGEGSGAARVQVALSTADIRALLRPVWAWAALGLVAMAALGLMWRSESPSGTRFCTASGLGGTPVAATPEGAFDRWWVEGGPDQTGRWVRSDFGRPAGGTAPVGEPSAADFVRTGDTSWEWRYAEDRSVLVTVGRLSGEDGRSRGWRVDGVNACGYE